MQLKQEFRKKKFLFILLLILINAILIFLISYFDNSWVQYLVICPVLAELAYITIEIALICIFYIGKKIRRLGKERAPVNLQNKSLAMVIPCYNQQEQELKTTINAYLTQNNIEKLKKLMFVIVDGKIKTKNLNINLNPNQAKKSQTLPNTQQMIKIENNSINSTESITTNILLQKIFQKSISSPTNFDKAYVCWKKQWMGVEVYNGIYQNMPYIIIAKNQNCSKRDSLALVYKLLYHLSGQQTIDQNFYSSQFIKHIENICKNNGITKFDYMMSTDADSEPSSNSAYDLIRQTERKPNILGSTGSIQVRFSDQKCNLLQLTQFQEYVSGQSVARLQQKLTSQKIHCLPGSLNLIKVCKQTCGKLVLDEYRFVSETKSLKQYIKNSASQDRHHIMIIFGLYGQSKTSLSYNSIVRTSVPLTLKHFFSQRKRWNLGTITHNFQMTFNIPNIPLWERVSSFMIILQFLILPTLLYCYARFILMLVRFGQGFYLDLSTYFIVLIALSAFRLIFMIAIGIVTPGLQFKQRILYLLLLLPFIFILNPLKAATCFLYNIWHLDDFNWIKGEQILSVPSQTKKPVTQTDYVIGDSIDITESAQSIQKNDVI